MKGDDGQVIKYTDDDNIDDDADVPAVKTKKSSKKSSKSKIQSEETLEMLMNAMKP